MSVSYIFDMDGTLFQTHKILERSLEDTFEVLRAKQLWDKDTPIELYWDIMGVPLEKVWETLLPRHSKEERVMANNYFQDKLIANIKDGLGALYPEVLTTFQYIIENNGEIYIASNGETKYLQAIVNCYELDKWVTETFSIQQIPSQNKVDLVSEILMKYEITNGVVIGDRLSDIQAAKENGLTSVGCDFDFAKPEELAQADIKIASLSQLREVVNTMQR